MNEFSNTPPVWFWIVSVLALIWNAFGIVNYLGYVYMSEEQLAAFPADQQAMFEATPGWVTGAFALAVFSGTIGCIGLLLRKKWSYHVLLVSLVAVIANMIYNLLISDMLEVMGSSAAILPIVVIVVAAFLVYFAKMATGKGWLG